MTIKDALLDVRVLVLMSAIAFKGGAFALSISAVFYEAVTQLERLQITLLK